MSPELRWARVLAFAVPFRYDVAKSSQNDFIGTRKRLRLRREKKNVSLTTLKLIRRRAWYLPVKLQRHLHLAWTIALVKNLTEGGTAKRSVGTAELRMIERIECLEAVFKAHSFTNFAQAELLKDGQVGVASARIARGTQGARRGAQRVLRWLCKEIAPV